MGKVYEPGGYDYIVNPDSGKLLAISKATGEVTDAVITTVPVGTVSYTPEQQEAIRKRKEQQKDFFNQSAMLDSLGRFSFVRVIQQFEDVSPETAARLVYLSTFLKWGNGTLLFSQRTKMSRDRLPDVMGLSRQTVDRFLNDVVPMYITFDDTGTIIMNPEYFFRGSIGKHGESASWRKIYLDSVRKLYRLAGKNNHRYLGYVFQLLPFISIQYNGLCYDIFEKDLYHVPFMDNKGFCSAIGYDYSSVSKLIKRYKKILFDVDGQHGAVLCVC